MATVTALLSGLVFGIGLLWSGLANPAKVLGFLDIAGRWDPSLVLVMTAAVSTAMLGFAAARRRVTSYLGVTLDLPASSAIDGRLVGGSAVFGMGWGITGFCPGPAVVGTGAGELKAVVFVAAMVLGMALFELIERLKASPGSGDPCP
ncbi:MAG: hypothetical protein KIT60_14810 [Burkholderiaceae bacterium]|nr:hypothetical protein [Burkholderiaceae bacterium]